MRYLVELVNGKRGYGMTSYLALVDAVGTRKADIICNFIKDGQTARGRRYNIYAQNTNLICVIEKL